MAELLIAGFLGLWLMGASILAYKQLKKDYQENGMLNGGNKT